VVVTSQSHWPQEGKVIPTLWPLAPNKTTTTTAQKANDLSHNKQSACSALMKRQHNFLHAAHSMQYQSMQDIYAKKAKMRLSSK
jgi:hypothetical protein